MRSLASILGIVSWPTHFWHQKSISLEKLSTKATINMSWVDAEEVMTDGMAVLAGVALLLLSELDVFCTMVNEYCNVVAFDLYFCYQCVL